MSQLDVIARHLSRLQQSDVGSICASIDELTDIVRVLTEDNDNWRRAELAARRERDHLRSQLDDVLNPLYRPELNCPNGPNCVAVRPCRGLECELLRPRL